MSKHSSQSVNVKVMLSNLWISKHSFKSTDVKKLPWEMNCFTSDKRENTASILCLASCVSLIHRFSPSSQGRCGTNWTLWSWRRSCCCLLRTRWCWGPRGWGRRPPTSHGRIGRGTTGSGSRGIQYDPNVAVPCLHGNCQSSETIIVLDMDVCVWMEQKVFHDVHVPMFSCNSSYQNYTPTNGKFSSMLEFGKIIIIKQ